MRCSRLDFTSVLEATSSSRYHTIFLAAPRNSQQEGDQAAAENNHPSIIKVQDHLSLGSLAVQLVKGGREVEKDLEGSR